MIFFCIFFKKIQVQKNIILRFLKNLKNAKKLLLTNLESCVNMISGILYAKMGKCPYFQGFKPFILYIMC